MFKFDYRNNHLCTKNSLYDLDLLRQWLLTNYESLCIPSKIKTIFRYQVIITSTSINGVIRKEINKAGEYANTYDWDAIFFKASKNGLLQKFINETNGIEQQRHSKKEGHTFLNLQ